MVWVYKFFINLNNKRLRLLLFFTTRFVDKLFRLRWVPFIVNKFKMHSVVLNFIYKLLNFFVYVILYVINVVCYSWLVIKENVVLKFIKFIQKVVKVFVFIYLIICSFLKR